MLSVQLLGELLPPNHEPFELLLIEGNQEELWELDGYHDDEVLEGHQLELDDEENIAEPSATPTPKPTPNTASTVEIG